MTLSIHAFAIDTFAPLLETLAILLDRGAEKVDPAVLLGARLAPDMYPLGRQVQLVCYQAVDAAARLGGKTPPPLETPDETLEELKARIAGTIEGLRQIPADGLDGAEDRLIVRPLVDDMRIEMSGLQYLRDWSFPNFYFHLVTAYDILRHHGVEIGKKDYMRHIGPAIRTGS